MVTSITTQVKHMPPGLLLPRRNQSYAVQITEESESEQR